MIIIKKKYIVIVCFGCFSCGVEIYMHEAKDIYVYKRQVPYRVMSWSSTMLSGFGKNFCGEKIVT